MATSARACRIGNAAPTRMYLPGPWRQLAPSEWARAMMLAQGMDGLGQERGGALHLAPPSGRRGAGRDRPTTRLPVREQRLKVELVPGRGARPGQCRANLDFAAARDMGRGAKFAPRPPSGSRWYHTGRITRPRIGLPPRGHLGPPDDDLRC